MSKCISICFKFNSFFFYLLLLLPFIRIRSCNLFGVRCVCYSRKKKKCNCKWFGVWCVFVHCDSLPCLFVAAAAASFTLCMLCCIVCLVSRVFDPRHAILRFALDKLRSIVKYES